MSMIAANITQPSLFDFSDSSSGVVELFPAVWGAVEGLTAPDVGTRREALDSLLELDAPRLSPLVASVLSTRLVDPDLELRFRVVRALGEVLSPSDPAKMPSPAVRLHIKFCLSQMRRREVDALLQVAEKYQAAESDIAALINACSSAGIALTDIVSDRKASLVTRRQAINFIGRIGFIDAIPALEKLAERLESRMNGQQTMPFTPPSESDEKSLLPAAQAALTLLEMP